MKRKTKEKVWRDAKYEKQIKNENKIRYQDREESSKEKPEEALKRWNIRKELKKENKIRYK